MSKDDAPKTPPSLPEDYEVPEVWKPSSMGGKWGGMNLPTAGPRFDRDLPKGEKPYQLYTLGTPNGMKVQIMMEELGLSYDAWLINIMEKDQFSSGFDEINPNAKIPALVDTTVDVPHSPVDGLRVFETGSILIYLAEKHGALIPKDPIGRAECLNWLNWQMGTAPYLGGGFGHFYAYAPIKIQYCIDRFSMETKRIVDVLDRHLGGTSIVDGKPNTYICGGEYTIADVAIAPWIHCLEVGYKAEKFLDLDSYVNVKRWLKLVLEREAVQKGIKLELKKSTD